MKDGRGGTCAGEGGREPPTRLQGVGKSDTFSVNLDQILVKLS